MKYAPISPGQVVDFLSRPFTPAWWCRGPHMQTLWPRLVRRKPRLSLRRERLELPDGDFIDLDWTQNSAGPIVIVLHGLEGSSRSIYARGLLCAIAKRGWRGVVMNFRGCSEEPNRLPRRYHSGDTGDLAYLVDILHQREPHTPLAAVGYSLGGNVLLKWLGSAKQTEKLTAAVAVSVPFVLAATADRMQRGFSRIYQWGLLRNLRRSTAAKRDIMDLPITVSDLSSLKTFREFDEHVTAPLHGFDGADQYYSVASSRQYLRNITVSTLVLHARDDPFMTEASIPLREELPASVMLELSSHGGHVGFVSGTWPWTARYWLEERIPEYLKNILI